ncbi:uncharacterized protein LOC141613886 [Silene latifolia]|uniref:uncharacterized protein LOC141613886 n=1 Tax=Silene latifolia TaxID=37657 RepID=UPI003D77B8A8
MDNGIFLVRFKHIESRDALLQSGYYMFDNKPIVIKPWNPDVDLIKEVVDEVPVWVKLSDIPVKFWGDCLPRITGLVGEFVMKDGDTSDKVRLSYARVMVKLRMNQNLPAKVRFLDENGKVIEVGVVYEWKPITCEGWKGLGHDKTQCRKVAKLKTVPKPKQNVKPKQVWVAKPSVTEPVFQPNSLFTPEGFPPLSTVKSTPARQIMRMNRQGAGTGIGLSGGSRPFTFIEALNKLATPKGGVETSGKDPPPDPINA